MFPIPILCCFCVGEIFCIIYWNEFLIALAIGFDIYCDKIVYNFSSSIHMHTCIVLRRCRPWGLKIFHGNCGTY